MTKKHILVISQYFYPEQFRINDICTEWIKRGYEVTVLTGIPNYPQGKFYDGYGIKKNRRELYNGINIIRIPIIPRGNKSIMLMLNYLSFVVTGFFWSLFARINADFVYIFEVSPMTQALPGVWYARKRKIPCYLYVTDLWPENVEIAGGVKNKTVLKVIGAMVDYIYVRCDRIFTSSKSFVKAIESRGVMKEKIEFWPQYAEDYYRPIKKDVVSDSRIPQDGVYNITFAGNIGFAQGLEILPQTANLLRNDAIKVRFNIIGDGRFKNKLVELVADENLSDYFNFIDKQPPNCIPEFMAMSDSALICLSRSEVFAITLPSKIQSCLACGMPIIASADGEIQEVIRSANAGVCSDAGDAQLLAEQIKIMIDKTPLENEIMSANALYYYNVNYNKDKLLNRMDRWFSVLEIKGE